MEESDTADRARRNFPKGSAYDVLEQRLGYRFRDPELLEHAMRHPSSDADGSGRGAGPVGYEKLEFLGDAVIELIVREALLREHPEETEGMLTRRKIACVSSENLSRRARELGLASFLETGPSLDNESLDMEGTSVPADVMEAVVGAVYLDGGLEPARELVQDRILVPTMVAGSVSPAADPKTMLQELCVEHYGEVPRYEITGREGPDHKPLFVASVYRGDLLLSRGTGRTKKSAHREAARSAIRKIETED